MPVPRPGQTVGSMTQADAAARIMCREPGSASLRVGESRPQCQCHCDESPDSDATDDSGGRRMIMIMTRMSRRMRRCPGRPLPLSESRRPAGRR